MSEFDRPSHPAASDDRHAEPVSAVAAGSGRTTREDVVGREKDEFGGMKFGSAFFGWLAATGMTVILASILGAITTAIGLGEGSDAAQAAEDATANADTVAIVAGIVLMVVLFVGYYCGGYVAGRMARFSGAKQGVAVWLWAVIIAVVLAIVGLIAGSQIDVLTQTGSFPAIPVDASDLTLASIVTLLVAAAVALGAAVLGGLAGMRYHRRVDRAGLGR